MVFSTNILGWLIVGLFVVVTCLACVLVILIRVTRVARGPVRERIAAVLYIGVSVAVINWLVGLGIIYHWIIGGDAFRGRVLGDVHYLGSGGEYIQVSPEFWWFSYYYQLASHVLMALFMGGIGVLIVWGWIEGEASGVIFQRGDENERTVKE